MLRNRVYLVDITHKGKAYPGQHEPIVSMDPWNKVHAVFPTNPNVRAQDTKFDVQGKTPALLRGLLVGEIDKLVMDQVRVALDAPE